MIENVLFGPFLIMNEIHGLPALHLAVQHLRTRRTNTYAQSVKQYQFVSQWLTAAKEGSQVNSRQHAHLGVVQLFTKVSQNCLILLKLPLGHGGSCLGGGGLLGHGGGTTESVGATPVEKWRRRDSGKTPQERFSSSACRSSFMTVHRHELPR
jgi:hypothetical protein